MRAERWPALPYDAWKDTYATLHMGAQIVGKIALAQASAVNHCCAVALELARIGDGPAASRQEVVHNRIRLRRAPTRDPHVGGGHVCCRSPALGGGYYRELMAALHAMDLSVRIWPMPVEIPSPIRFEQDTGHRSYDPEPL